MPKMSKLENKVHGATNPADALFPRVRQRVLEVLFGSPGRSFHVLELIRKVGGGSGAVQRELARLAGSGLLTFHRQGTQKHYQANSASPIYEELCSIARKVLAGSCAAWAKSPMGKDCVDVVDIGGLAISRQALRVIAERYDIKRITLFGSAARGELRPDSDIDLLVEFHKGRGPSLGGLVEINSAMSDVFGGRDVEVSTMVILQNPFRRREIEKDMELLYAA
jgi:predicted nucleotidyltransferase